MLCVHELQTLAHYGFLNSEFLTFAFATLSQLSCRSWRCDSTVISGHSGAVGVRRILSWRYGSARPEPWWGPKGWKRGLGFGKGLRIVSWGPRESCQLPQQGPGRSPGRPTVFLYFKCTTGWHLLLYSIGAFCTANWGEGFWPLTSALRYATAQWCANFTWFVNVLCTIFNHNSTMPSNP